MGAEYDKSRPWWATRLLAAVGYIGFTPLLRLFRVRCHDVYLQHHQTQGLATFLLLILLLLIWPIYLMLETYLVRNHVGQESHYHAAEAGITIVFLGGLGLWGLTSIVGMGMALAGSTRPLPLIGWLARRPRIMRVALIGNSGLMVLAFLVVGLAIHASSLVREDAVPAPVYFLYDNQGFEILGHLGAETVLLSNLSRRSAALGARRCSGGPAQSSQSRDCHHAWTVRGSDRPRRLGRHFDGR